MIPIQKILKKLGEFFFHLKQYFAFKILTEERINTYRFPCYVREYQNPYFKPKTS